MQINVVYAVNESFLKYTYLSLFSILNHLWKNNTLWCYIITPVKNNKYITKMKNLPKQFINLKIQIINIDNEDFKNISVSKLTTTWHIDYSTYYRFSIDRIEWINKIIYIDADTIINGDISSLFKEDLEDKIVGVCSDMPKEYMGTHIKELKLKKKQYFNAGMLLINLDKWKQFDVSKKCLSLLSKRVFKFNDQDVLNIVLQDQCKWLPWKYNMQTDYFIDDEQFYEIGFDKSYYKNAIINPVIIHFTWWITKPWNIFSWHPYRNKYYDTLFLANKKNILLTERFIYIMYKLEIIFIPNYKIRQSIRIKLSRIYRTLQGKFQNLKKIIEKL